MCVEMTLIRMRGRSILARTSWSVVEGYRDRLSGWGIAIDKIPIRSSGAGELIVFSDRSINGSL